MQFSLNISAGLIVLALVLLYLGMNAFSMWNQQIRMDAYDDCIRSGQITYTTETGDQVSEPSGNWYDRCVTDKGL